LKTILLHQSFSCSLVRATHLHKGFGYAQQRFFLRLFPFFGCTQKIEQFIVGLAIGSFLLHLLVIFLVDFDILPLNESSDLLKNPIAAIYTPFSFILLYEVYLLVYYLPKSITIYIGKQYEIITLILIRRVFKDLSQIELTSDWFSIQNDLQLT